MIVNQQKASWIEHKKDESRDFIPVHTLKEETMDIKEYLKEHVLITDGAMGTYYSQCFAGDDTIAEEANIEQPERVVQIHKAYIEQGARLIRTNTFALNKASVSQFKNGGEDYDAYIEKGIRAAVEHARTAAAMCEEDVFIGASIGPVPFWNMEDGGNIENRCNGKTNRDSGTGEIFETDESNEMNENPEDAEYRRNIDIFLEEGVDIFVLETFSSVEPVKMMAAYIKEKCPNAFVIGQFSIQPTGYSQMGRSVERMFAEAAKIKELDCVGLNCNIGVAHMHKYLSRVELPGDKYISALPNCGYPHVVRGKTMYSDSASYYGEGMEKIAALGVNIVGGCCGTTPLYIGEISKRLAETAPVNRAAKPESILPDGKKEFSYPLIEKMNRGEKVIAVELDPPFDENVTKLMEGAYFLKEKGIDMITIADSPMARSRADSLLVAAKLQRDVGVTVLPHFTCRDKNRIAVRSGVLGAYINEIRNLLVVTGDPVGAGDKDNTKAVFDFNSIRMMEFIQHMNEEHFSGEPICIGAALNHNTASVDALIRRMEKKIQAGASFFLTQPIYDDASIERIRLIKERLNTKILCGIMPLVSYRNASFIKNEMPGIYVPDEILNRYHPEMSKAEAEDVAVDICMELMGKMEDVADGWYFMTPFNRVGLIGRLIDGTNSYLMK